MKTTVEIIVQKIMLELGMLPDEFPTEKINNLIKPFLDENENLQYRLHNANELLKSKTFMLRCLKLLIEERIVTDRDKQVFDEIFANF